MVRKTTQEPREAKDAEELLQNKSRGAAEKIFMTEDQKIMVEPWIAVFGKEVIEKLFSKKFADKEQAINECDEFMKSNRFRGSKDTLKVACSIVNQAV